MSLFIIIITNIVLSTVQNREAQALLPVTVKQIISALVSTDDKLNILIDGVDVTNVSLLQNSALLLHVWNT